MSNDPKPIRWRRCDHPERGFLNVPERVPWPAEGKEPDPKERFPGDVLYEGMQRLRAQGGDEWTPEWEAFMKFIDETEEMETFVREGRSLEAVRKLEELERIHAGSGFVPFNRAFFLQTFGDLDGARDAAVEATERAPKVEWIWMRRAELHEALDEEKEATFCFRRALSLLPTNQLAFEGLCRTGDMLKVTRKRPDGEVEFRYQSRKDFRREQTKVLSELPATDPGLRKDLRQLFEIGEWEMALMVVNRILSTRPPDVEELQVKKASALRRLGRFREAHAVLDGVHLSGSALAEAHFERAFCFFGEKANERAWKRIDRALEADPNHQHAIMVKFRLKSENHDNAVISRVAAWAAEHGSWRGYFCASVQASTLKDRKQALEMAEQAYRLAPHERDAVFIYATALNNMDESEYTAALLHPRLPAIQGDYQLKYVFAGAMKKLGLPEEARRVLEEALAESRDIPLEWRENLQSFRDNLAGLQAESEVEADRFPGTEVLSREIWHATDEGPKQLFIEAGRPLPVTQDFTIPLPADWPHSTVSWQLTMHSQHGDAEPATLGWFRLHELDFSAQDAPPAILHVRVTKEGVLKACGSQGERRLPVTWSLYRAPSMEQEARRE